MLIYRQFVIPASYAQSRDAELDRIALWAQANNLKLNRTKSVEIIFTDRRRKHAVCYLPAIPDIPRVTSIKILGVVFINLLSVSEHWARRWRHQQVCTVAPCTQSLALSRHEWRRAEGRIQVGVLACMRLLRGGGSRHHPSKCKLKKSCVEVFDSVCTERTIPQRQNLLLISTTLCSDLYCITFVTSFITSYLTAPVCYLPATWSTWSYIKLTVKSCYSFAFCQLCIKQICICMCM